MANGFGVGSRRQEPIPPPPCPREHPAGPFPELWRGPGMAPSSPCSVMPLGRWPRSQQVAGGTKQGMRRRCPDFKLGQEVGAAGTAPSWARHPVGMAPSWARHPCPMLGAARGAVADGRTRSLCPWAHSAALEAGSGTKHSPPRLTLAQPLGMEGSPPSPSPPHSPPLDFMHHFVV